MKRILSLLLVLVLMFSMVACGGSEDSQKVSAAAEPVRPQTCPVNVNDAYYKYASTPPDIIYSTSGSENGLTGNIYKFEGTVESIAVMDSSGTNVDYAKVSTDRGTVLVINMYSALYEQLVAAVGKELANEVFYENVEDYIFPEIGETATFLTVYEGFSTTEEVPSFWLGANANIFAFLGYDDPVAPVLTGQTENNEVDSSAPSQVSASEIMAQMEAAANGNLDYFATEGDETGITVSMAMNGVAEMLVLASSLGYDENFEPWASTRETVLDFYFLFEELLAANGRSDLVLMVNLMNDTNYDNCLLSAYRGEIVYDALAVMYSN